MFWAVFQDPSPFRERTLRFHQGPWEASPSGPWQRPLRLYSLHSEVSLEAFYLRRPRRSMCLCVTMCFHIWMTRGMEPGRTAKLLFAGWPWVSHFHLSILAACKLEIWLPFSLPCIPIRGQQQRCSFLDSNHSPQTKSQISASQWIPQAIDIPVWSCAWGRGNWEPVVLF